MKENEMKPQADPVLDAELAQMAEEVPPMPADFHEKWMNAVRSEARQSAPAAENTEIKASVSLTRWTRILSIAAVFVFLIGGTILYRNSQETLSSAAFRTEAKNAVMLSVEAPAAGAVSEEREEAEAPEKDAAEGAVMMAGESAVSETVFEDYAVPEEAASYEETANDAAAYDASEETVMSEAEEADLGAYEAAPMAAMKAAEKPAATLMPTAAPTLSATESAPEAEEVAEEETAGETEEEPGQEAEAAQEEAGLIQQAGAFLSDMGSFLLAALPYLLVLAVPAAAALIIRRKKK